MSTGKISRIVLTVALLGAAVAAAQETDLGPVPEDVLGRIPAGCMGFVYVRDVGKTAAAAEKFMDAINPPGQAMIPPVRILPMIRQQAGLGEGFDERGGFAVVMLDPQQYDFDLAKVFSDQAGEITLDKVPLVMLIPGKDPAKMFATRSPGKEDGIDTFVGDDGKPCYCKQVGGYIAMSPNKKAMLDLASGKAKPVATALSDEDKAFIKDNAAGVWVNYKLLGPVVDAKLAELEKEAAEVRKRMEDPNVTIMNPAELVTMGLGQSIGAWRPMLRQLDALALGVRIGGEGFMLDVRGQFAADSEMGKLHAAYKPVAVPLLARLPDLPYAVAIGVRQEVMWPKDLREKQADAALAQEPFAKLKPETKSKLRKMMLDWGELFKGVELIAAPGGPDKGALRLAMVVEVTDAARARQMIADVPAIIDELIALEKKDNPDAPKITVKFAPAAETVAGRKVDLMTVEIGGMDEEAAKALRGVFGDDKVHIRIAEAGPKTLVMTAGGGSPFVGEAAAAAVAGKGKLEQDPAVKAALAKLPGPRQGVIVVSAKNILTLIHNIEQNMGKPVGASQIGSDAPFAIGVALQGSGARATVHAPAATIRDIMSAIMSAMSEGMEPGMDDGPPPGF